MEMTLLLFILSASLPYYVVLEAIKGIKSEYIFILSWVALLAASISEAYLHLAFTDMYIGVALASALFSIYKATKTTNFYKLGYYLIFVNAPFFVIFEQSGAFYSISLLVALIGLYLTAKFYEKNYGSANYHYIRGVILSTPYIGMYLVVYLIALAIYPPFPNALFFLSYILQSETNTLWFVVVITLFLGNFFLVMRVLKASLFGKPNTNIHYVDLSLFEKVVHFIVVIGMLLLSLYGLKEMLL